MKTTTIEGWLFDLEEMGTALTLWVYTNGGQLLKLTDEFHPPFCVTGEVEAIKRLTATLYRQGLITGGRWAERTEFWSGNTMEAFELNVTDASLLPKLRTIAGTLDQHFQFYNFDIPVAQHYCTLRQLFPTCRLTAEIDAFGNVQAIAATDSMWEMNYRLPDLRILKMHGEKMQPLNPHSRLILECAGAELTLPLQADARTIERFNTFLAEQNPDLLLSERGDTILLPTLLQVAKQANTPLKLDRDQVVTTRRIETEGRTYFSYGRVIYKGPNYPLFGRWHLDATNSFTYHEAKLAGVIELARLSRMPVQRVARTSPGSAMSAMTLDTALQQGMLVPWRKSEPEAYKSGLSLLMVDKGGMVFQPPVGAFENVAEIDFASMYPTLMVRHNLSPETVLCHCCENTEVPEAKYNVCRKRRGLMGITLAPLIERRRQLKLQAKQTDDEQERKVLAARRTAIKWMLVSCFGYLGYKNARFGRIEAHEAVTAWGREILLQAKELAESYGYEVLHALTDSLWVRKRGLNESDVKLLCDRITMATKIEMSLEGVYRWLEFLPSKSNPTRPVPHRYFGLFTHSEMKVRGLACRRSDTPEFIKAAQQELLALLTQAHTLTARQHIQPQLDALVQTYLTQLERGELGAKQLAVQQVLTREPEEYAVSTRAALAAEQYRAAGVPVHPGERLSYVLKDAKAKDKADRVAVAASETPLVYDVVEYIRLLKAAAAEVSFEGATT